MLDLLIMCLTHKSISSWIIPEAGPEITEHLPSAFCQPCTWLTSFTAGTEKEADIP